MNQSNPLLYCIVMRHDFARIHPIIRKSRTMFCGAINFLLNTKIGLFHFERKEERKSSFNRWYYGEGLFVLHIKYLNFLYLDLFLYSYKTKYDVYIILISSLQTNINFNLYLFKKYSLVGKIFENTYIVWYKAICCLYAVYLIYDLLTLKQN